MFSCTRRQTRLFFVRSFPQMVLVLLTETDEGDRSTEHEQPECEPDVVGDETRRYSRHVRHAPDRLVH